MTLGVVYWLTANWQSCANGKNRVTVNITPDYGTAIWPLICRTHVEQLDGASLAYVGFALAKTNSRV